MSADEFSDWECERCHACGYPHGEVWWSEDNAIWRQVYKTMTGEDRGGGGVLCMACFQVGYDGLDLGLLQWVARSL